MERGGTTLGRVNVDKYCKGGKQGTQGKPPVRLGLTKTQPSYNHCGDGRCDLLITMPPWLIKEYSMGHSQMLNHPIINPMQQCLSLMNWQETVSPFSLVQAILSQSYQCQELHKVRVRTGLLCSPDILSYKYMDLRKLKQPKKWKNEGFYLTKEG